MGLLGCKVTNLILKSFNYSLVSRFPRKGYICLSGDYSRMPADERAYFTLTMVLGLEHELMGCACMDPDYYRVIS